MNYRLVVIFIARCTLLALGPLLNGCDTGTLDSSSASPVITSVVPTSGKVGTTVAIQGTSFGTTAGTANFQDSSGNTFSAQIDTWTDSLILTRVPSVTGSDTAAVSTKVGLTTSGGVSPASLPAFSVTTQ